MEEENIKRFLNSYDKIGSPNMNMRRNIPFKFENKYNYAEEVLIDLNRKLRREKIKIKSHKNMKALCYALYENDMRIIYALSILILFIKFLYL